MHGMHVIQKQHTHVHVPIMSFDLCHIAIFGRRCMGSVRRQRSTESNKFAGSGDVDLSGRLCCVNFVSGSPNCGSVFHCTHYDLCIFHPVSCRTQRGQVAWPASGCGAMHFHACDVNDMSLGFVRLWVQYAATRLARAEHASETLARAKCRFLCVSLHSSVCDLCALLPERFLSVLCLCDHWKRGCWQFDVWLQVFFCVRV